MTATTITAGTISGGGGGGGTPIEGSLTEELAPGDTTLTIPDNAQYVYMNLISGGGGYGSSVDILGDEILGEENSELSGYSVAINSAGDRVVLGAIGNDSFTGAVRIFEYDGSSWGKLGADIPGEQAGEQAGRSVDINTVGDRIVLGAPVNDDGGTDAGDTRIYEFSGGSWSKLGSDIPGSTGDQSGTYVAINAAGDRVVIGSPLNDDAGSNAGVTRVYEFSGGSWSQLGSDIPGEQANERSGISVGINAAGDRVVVGALLNDGTAGTDAGVTRVYEFSGGSWSKLGSDIEGEQAGERSGFSVDINGSGNRVVVGAILNDSAGTDAGVTRVYEFIGGSWSKLGADIEGEQAGERSGYSVGINTIGDRIVTGAYANDSFTGAVRVFKYNSSSWNKLGDVAGTQTGEQAGFSANISGTDRIVFSAPENDTFGTNAGATRVYAVSDLSGGGAGAEMIVGYPVSGNDFTFSVGSGGDVNENGEDTTLTITGTNANVFTVSGGITGSAITESGLSGYYNGYGAGGGVPDLGNGGSSKAVNGSGADGRVVIRYS